MSTRCQVTLFFDTRRKGLGKTAIGKGKSITLYHHCDGYPENMIPLLIRAYNGGKQGIINDYQISGDRLNDSYGIYFRSLYSPVKAVNHLVAADPTGFEIESANFKWTLHSDIEFYYKIFVNKKSWAIQVFVPQSFHDFWDNPTFSRLSAISPRMTLKQAEFWLARYEQERNER